MSDSTYVFESGEAITIGEHGEDAYTFESGTPVLNQGESTLVFESGTGIGGALNEWETANDIGAGASATIGVSPRIKLEHDGVTDNFSFVGAARVDSVGSAPFEVTFTNVEYTANSEENNLLIGITDDKSLAAKYFGENTGQSLNYACYFYQERDSGPPYSGFRTGNTDVTVDRQYFSHDPAGTHDYTIGFDGTDAYLKIDGTEVARSSVPDDSTYYGAISNEDDGDTSAAETVTVESYNET